MAMKDPIKFASTAVACAVVAIALLPPQQQEALRDWSYSTSDITEERYRLNTTLTRTVRAWRTASRRDSVVKLLHGSSVSESVPRILADSILSPEIRQLGNAAIETAWTKLGIASPKSSPTVLMLRDHYEDSAGYGVGQLAGEGIEYMVPAPGDSAGNCVTLLMFRSISNNRTAVQRFLNRGGRTRSTVFGPCAFYAAFGAPGERIRSWLEGRRYDFAMNSDWSSTTEADRPTRLRGSGPGGATLFEVVVGNTDMFEMSVTQRDCWLGNAAACEAVVLAPLQDTPMSLGRVSGVYQPEGIGFYGNQAWTDGYRDYLADMRRDIGAEKFARFWTANEEPAVAFRNATGESLGEWTHKWVVSLYGQTIAGAKVPASHFGIGLLFAFGCVSIAAAVVSRRTVG